MELRRKEDPPSPCRGGEGERGWGFKSPREAATGTRQKETEAERSGLLLLSPQFCATQFIWIEKILCLLQTAES